jgi:hypothetical protein
MKNPTEKDFLELMGRISRVFSSLDFMVTILLYKLIDGKGIDDLKITDKKTLGQKLRIMKKLKKDNVSYPESLNKIKELLSEAIKIANERNSYEHDQWLFDKSKIEKGMITKLKICRKNKLNVNIINIKEKTFTLGIMNDFLKDIISMQNKISKIDKELPLLNKDKVIPSKN